MTTVTKTSVPLVAPVTNNGVINKSKSDPGVSSGWIDIRAYDGGNLGLSILNGASGPGSAPSLVIQWSPDGTSTKVYDLLMYGGDTAGSSYNSATFWIDPGIPYIRVIGYGNTTNPVTFGADFSGVARA